MTDLFESSDKFDDEITAPEVAIENQEKLASESFESGLNQSLGVEPASAVVEPIKPSVTEEAKTLFAGYTEDQVKEVFGKAQQFDELNSRLTKTHDTAFGKIGQLEQTIKELKAARENLPEAKPLTKDSFKSLAEYLDDEDMAIALAKDLSELHLGGQQAEVIPVDYDAINAAFEEKFLTMSQSFTAKADETKKDFEIKLLTVQHPNWKDISVSDDFSNWKATLKQEARDTLNSTWDGTILGNAFTSFNKWQEKKAEITEKKQQRLQDALLPNSSSGRTQEPADDAFNQGLKQVLKNR